MNTTGWIQASDYSSIKLGEVSFEQAAHAVRTFPWDQRLQEFTELVLRKADACPPGVGFNAGKHNCFHVYAVALNEWRLYLRLSRPAKFLGLFRKPLTTLYSEVRSIEQVVELLRLFFAGDVGRLATEAAKYPSREAVRPRLG